MNRAAPILVLLAFVLPATAAADSLAGPDASRVREGVLAHVESQKMVILGELAAFLQIPNVASDKLNIEKNALWISAALQKRGVRVELLRTADAPPVVYGELKAPGASRTVILYAHYDGQPVTRSQWASDPWAPTLRDRPLEEGGLEVSASRLRGPFDPEWRLYARSASDDKAPIVALLTALDILKDRSLPLSVNLKFFFEGEEEAGSPHLEALLAKNADRLKGDLWLLFDGPVHPTRRMQIYFGARGITDVEITTYGAARRLHSGHYGNWAPNPIVELAHLVASMRDTSGRIRIPGFSDDVRPLSRSERRAVEAMPPIETKLKEDLALAGSEGGQESLAEAILRPALNMRGIAGGEVGERTTNSIPTEATASIDFRLVPDQTPEKIRQLVEAHVRKQGFFVTADVPDRAARLAHPRIARLRWGPGYPAARTSMDLPVSAAVAVVVAEATGAPLIQVPSLGGSIPMYLFLEKLKTPVIGIPIVNHDNNQHAPNENLRLENLWEGIGTFTALLSRLGYAWR